MDRTYFKNLSESLWDHNNDAHYFRDKPKPTLPHKAHTADLSRFMGRKKQRMDWHNANLCAVFSNISISLTVRRTAGRKPKPDEHTNH